MGIDKTYVYGFEPAILGMRNPMNSWNLSDSKGEKIGPKDMELAKKLIKAGPEHCKFLRMIQVWTDIEMPRYWWSEFDTYHHNTKNSCSTMHKLFTKQGYITKDMFAFCEEDEEKIETIIQWLNEMQNEWDIAETQKEKDYILLRAKRILPEGFFQLRTVNTNYAELRNIYHQRKNHRLKEEWQGTFCEWVQTLPYAELITK